MRKLYYSEIHGQIYFVEENEDTPTMILSKINCAIKLQIAESKLKRFKKMIDYIENKLDFYFDKSDYSFRLLFTVKVDEETFNELFVLFLKTMNESKTVLLIEDNRK